MANQKSKIIAEDFDKKINSTLYKYGEYLMDTISNIDNPQYHIFYGNKDWHSSVHAHLALLLCSYLLHNNWGYFVLSKLNYESVIAERLYLMENKSFEMPYGRAWLLLLAVCLKRLYNSDILLKFASDVYLSLMEYMQRKCNAKTIDYQSETFVLFCMAAYDKYLKNGSERKFYLEQLNFCHRTIKDVKYSDDTKSNNFFSIKGMYIILCYVLVPNDSKYLNGLDEVAPEPIELSGLQNVNQYGINYNRVPALVCQWTYTKNSEFLDACKKHLTKMDTYLPNIIDPSNYATIGHWIPQFGIFAIWAYLMGTKSKWI